VGFGGLNAEEDAEVVSFLGYGVEVALDVGGQRVDPFAVEDTVRPGLGPHDDQLLLGELDGALVHLGQGPVLLPGSSEVSEGGPALEEVDLVVGEPVEDGLAVVVVVEVPEQVDDLRVRCHHASPAKWWRSATAMASLMWIIR